MGIGGFPNEVFSQKCWDPPSIRVFPNHESTSVDQLIKDGRLLFKTKFNIRDGAGRPAATGDSKPTPRFLVKERKFHRIAGPDASSCFSCHNDPEVGGSGDIATNVFVGAHFSDPPTQSVSGNVTNERNTTSILGSGAIELLASEITDELRSLREKALKTAIEGGQKVQVKLVSKGIEFGSVIVRPDGTYDNSQLKGIDDDLVLKPFGSKGVAISLREFTIAALNQHHGIQAIERFGWERTGRKDFDMDGVTHEFSIGQVSALVLFQAISLPARRSEIKHFQKNLNQFRAIGCADCHVPYLDTQSSLFSEPNLYNRPGNIRPADIQRQIKVPIPVDTSERGAVQKNDRGGLRVWLFSDLRRHNITDSDENAPNLGQEYLRQDNVPEAQFMTPRLWELATSAPYGHRGDYSTVSEVILAHGGEAAKSREKFLTLTAEEKKSLIAFLLSLGGDTGSEKDSLSSKGGR